jgi:hypothetical protein
VIRLLTTFMILVFIISCCCSSDNNNQSIETLAFEIDETLLSNPVADDSLHIVFQVPQNLKPLSEKYESGFESKLDAMNLGDMNISIQPTYIFVDSSYSFFLMVSLIHNDSHREKLESTYNSYLKKHLEKYILKSGKFNKDGIIMTQYIINDGAKMILKLFFSIDGQRFVQFDYFILANYEQQIKAIESSIGSIQKNAKGGE